MTGAQATSTSGRFEAIPTVQRPRSGLPNWALFALAGVLGVGIFSVLASQRQSAEQTDIFEPNANTLIASPPPLSISSPQLRAPDFSASRSPVPFAPQPPVVIRPVPARPVRVLDPRVETPPSSYSIFPPFSPPLIAASSQPITEPSGPTPALVLDRGISRLDRSGARLRDLARRDVGQSEQAVPDAAASVVLRPKAPLTGPTILPVGTMMPAILQTPVDTSRGGPVTAIVSQDVKGQDGSRVLVPKGSKLLGEYAAGAEGAGKRVLINWTRLLLPDGNEVVISFPATDKNGAAGVKGDLHTNALGRIAGAVFQTALNTATFGLLNGASSDTIILGPPPVAVTGQARATASQRRITIDAGEKIQVMVTQPIDFTH